MPFNSEGNEAFRRAVQMVPFNHTSRDWQRFYIFVIKMFRLGNERPTDSELKERLEEIFPGTNIPTELTQFYSRGIELLTELPHVR